MSNLVKDFANSIFNYYYSSCSYGLVTQVFQLGAYMILFLGLTMLMSGLQQLKRNSKLMGGLLIGVFAFSMFVGIQSFMLNY